MKKSLLATTALAALGAVAVAGPAAAAERISIGVGGYMEQWFAYSDNSADRNDDNNGFDQQSDVEIHFTGETTLDNGLTVGINVQLEGQTDNGDDDGFTDANDQIDEQYLYIEGSFGRFLMGSENNAAYLMHYGIPSHGAGIDSGDSTQYIAGTDFSAARTNGRGDDNDSEKITYFTPRFAGFQLGASYIPQLNQDADFVSGLDAPREDDDVRDDGFAFGLNFDRAFNDFRVRASAGYYNSGESTSSNDDEEESYQFGLRLGYAGFTLAGTYGIEDRTPDLEQETIGVGLSYASGPFGVSFGYIGADLDGDNGVDDQDQDAFELGAKYALGPGIDVKGSIFYVNRDVGDVEFADGFAVVGGLDLAF